MKVSKYQQILEEAAVTGAYYRENPDEFAEDYLHIKLHLFQRILLIMMFTVTTFVFVACRGIGKTFLSAIYCCIRCILWPGSQVCVASGTRGQGILVLEKIMFELEKKSPELAAEIDEKKTQINGTNARIYFKNTSVIKVVTASDNSRGNRCNVLLLDEFRLINKNTINTVLRKFLIWRRTPEYANLTDEQRKQEYNKEKPLTLYLSSAFFTTHWSYLKCLDTYEAMLDDQQKQFVCGFPYELAIAEGRLDPETCIEEMSESDFSEIKWSMEMDALFYGSSEDAFFDSESLSKTRKIQYPMLPDKTCSLLGNPPNLRILPKKNGEIRILSADIALMSSRKVMNDATAVFINCMTPTKAGRYVSNFVYTESHEGLRTDDQALLIRKLFDEYQCNYLVLDTNGIGLGVYDCLARDIVDTDTGEIYPALSCCNNTEMASRCTVPGARKAIWSIKASAQMNSDCAYLLREAIRSGRVRLLCTEYDADEVLKSLRGYASLSESDKIKVKLPYINTDFCADELIKLQHEESGGKIKISERSGMRKDRYSSLSYNYYVAIQLENKTTKRQSTNASASDMFIIKPPNYQGQTRGKAVSTISGKKKREKRAIRL